MIPGTILLGIYYPGKVSNIPETKPVYDEDFVSNYYTEITGISINFVNSNTLAL